uniref:Uncharacterized protein n=1 Tax=Clastoptera arizonana TaxID=38151 RepID=A0A1B6C197_9HEMI
MDPIFLSYSQVNGVPQESKLATYMKHQNEGSQSGVTSQSTTKNTLTFDQIPVSLKKVVGQTGEFIPRTNINNSPSGAYSSRSSLVESPSSTPPTTPAPLIITCSPTQLLDKTTTTYQASIKNDFVKL